MIEAGLFIFKGVVGISFDGSHGKMHLHIFRSSMEAGCRDPVRAGDSDAVDAVFFGSICGTEQDFEFANLVPSVKGTALILPFDPDLLGS
jgi:hypothetical protein